MPAIRWQERCIDVPTVRIIFAGGGTGGHLFPAIAIANEIMNVQPDAEILFVGTKHKIEARVVPPLGFKFITIWISGFHRGLKLRNLLFPIKVLVSMVQAYKIIKQFKPSVVVGTGGYVSGPMLRMATMMNVPTLIQEQNSYPGVTTRMLAQKVNEVHLTFESSRKYIPRTEQVFVSGNPVREGLGSVQKNEALTYFGFDGQEQKRTILVFGGSLGAHTINNAVEQHLDELLRQNIRLIWQTGKEDIEHTQKYSSSNVWVSAFIDRMDYAYAASDLVICRAGATTIAELTMLGKPAILVPYPRAAANHQVENARSVVQSGAAEMVYDNDVQNKLLPVVCSLLNDDRLQRMSDRSKKLGMPQAAKNIAQRVLTLAKSSFVAA